MGNMPASLQLLVATGQPYHALACKQVTLTSVSPSSSVSFSVTCKDVLTGFGAHMKAG